MVDPRNALRVRADGDLARDPNPDHLPHDVKAKKYHLNLIFHLPEQQPFAFETGSAAARVRAPNYGASPKRNVVFEVSAMWKRASPDQ